MKKTNESSTKTGKKSARGFAAMTAEQRRTIAQKGGMAVSSNRDHMAKIGQSGGQKVSQDRQHMSEIGQKGGRRSRKAPKKG